MDFSRIAKVLALAASENETEALTALRTLKRLLEAGGKDFVSLSQMIEDPNAGSANSEALQDAVFDLRNEIRHLRAENERLRQSHSTAAGGTVAAQQADELNRIKTEYQIVMAELDAQAREIQHLRNVETTMRRSFQEALTEANRTKEQLKAQEAKSSKLETDLQRMAMMNHALGVDLMQAKKAQRAAAVAKVVVKPLEPKATDSAAPSVVIREIVPKTPPPPASCQPARDQSSSDQAQLDKTQADKAQADKTQADKASRPKRSRSKGGKGHGQSAQFALF